MFIKDKVFFYEHARKLLLQPYKLWGKKMVKNPLRTGTTDASTVRLTHGQFHRPCLLILAP